MLAGGFRLVNSKVALYDKIGIGYDTTRRADPFILSRLLHYLAPVKGRLYLDVGCGTGNYTAAIELRTAAGLATVHVEPPAEP